VVVNGKLTSEPGVKVKPRKDIILVDGKKVVLPDSKSTFWVVVNKPRSVLTTMVDEKDRDTLLSIVPKVYIICLRVSLQHQLYFSE
jgi:23S rRNA pseudouridine2605 synthase